ncbi:DEAD/DEAH box helicase [Microbacterium schleiferi]|uniref:DEAD/DEAH box helicase n=1 Tax=Microbacterium schleiferi TaxID=69362 RepID=A0A7S8MZ92_9MICO|nr:DEAD/DEAH box helicase [Microbacterium schleiferi]QPE05648.1 DEAD/DEAH box helicase [Microbacterium schleiferi]
MTTFLDLGVPAVLAEVLSAEGKAEAFPIQADTLPDSLAGRDVLGRGRTGSGKTIAFALPMVARIAASSTPLTSGRPRGLVLAPTRELATQIAATIEPLANAVGLRVTTIFGGVSQRPQEQALRAGVDIVVACPGRLEDLMKQQVVRLDRVEISVLDEADHMADLGFLPGVTRILTATPADGQRLLFSATLDGGIDGLARRFLSSPVSHEVDESSVPAGEMTHRVLLVPGTEEKTALVRELASGQGRRILFTRTKHQAKKLAKQLTAAGIPAVDLHGNLSQNARDRNLAAFSAAPENGGVRVLVATDVAARGVHVDQVELVVHVDPPVEHKAYLHRSGRTARAGAEGTVVTVGLEAQRREIAQLLKKAGIQVEPDSVRASSASVDTLVGPRAPHRMLPATAPVASSARPARSGGSGSGGQRSGGGQRGTQPARSAKQGHTAKPTHAHNPRHGADQGVAADRNPQRTTDGAPARRRRGSRGRGSGQRPAAQ